MSIISEPIEEPAAQSENSLESVTSRESLGVSLMPLVAAHGEPPAGYKLNPLYIETKSKRLQLLMQQAF